MKKFLVVLMSVLFLGATTGLAVAQMTTTKPAMKTSGKGKGGKKKSHTKKTKGTGSKSAPATTK